MKLVTREIVPDAWPQFLDQMTREHRGHRFDVRVSAPDVGLQSHSTRLTLLGITTEESREGIDPVPESGRTVLTVLRNGLRAALPHRRQVRFYCVWRDLKNRGDWI